MQIKWSEAYKEINLRRINMKSMVHFGPDLSGCEPWAVGAL